MIKITYKTHSTGGLLFGLLFIGPFLVDLLLSIDIVSIFVMSLIFSSFLIVGSLTPDIDHPRSFMGRRFPLISKSIYSKYGHRTITHSLLTVLFFIIFSYFVLLVFRVFFYDFYFEYRIFILPIPLGFILGYISHIFLDMFNSKGVFIIYPYGKKYRLPYAPNITVCSKEEWKFNNFLEFLIFILLLIYVAATAKIFIMDIFKIFA